MITIESKIRTGKAMRDYNKQAKSVEILKQRKVD
jgi:hypothetical protein